MNWIKENKFLTGYFAVVLIATGILGYFLFTGKGRYDEAVETYTNQSNELHRLKSLPLFPNQANLNLLDGQKDQEKKKIDELQESLAGAKLPVDAMTPERFQDKLRVSVTDFVKKAGDVGMALPKGFFMGFDRYQSIPPKPAAAPLLGRELKAMEMVLDELPMHGVVELKKITREDLPEEEIGAGKMEQPKRTGPGQPSAKGPQNRTEKAPLVESHGFEITFLAPKGGSQLTLNSIVSNKFQCLVPRLVVLKNEKPKGPLRDTTPIGGPLPGPGPATPTAPVPGNVGGIPAAPRPPGSALIPAPGAPPTPPEAAESHEFIVGDERVEATFRIEIVDIADLPAAKPVAAK